MTEFDDPGELVYDSGSFSTALEASGGFTVPDSGARGMTRMRVSMRAAAAGDSSDAVPPGPCAVFAVGEVEDYTIVIPYLISPPGVPLRTPTKKP